MTRPSRHPLGNYLQTNGGKITLLNCTSTTKRLFTKDFDWTPKTGKFLDRAGSLSFDSYDGSTRSIASTNQDGASGPSLTLDRLRADYATVHDNLPSGEIQFRGRDANGNTQTAARLVGKVNQNWANNWRGGFAMISATPSGEEEVVAYDGRTKALTFKNDQLGFYGFGPVPIQFVGGTAGSREWAQSLMTVLLNMGLVFNQTV